MNILGTQYTAQQKAFEIYLSGCNANPHCKNCHNPESWNFNCGEPYDDIYFHKILTKVNEFSSLIENIWILGGEPLDQDRKELKTFLFEMGNFNKCLWLFTRYEMDEIPRDIKKLCDYIKTGPYIETLSVDKNMHYGVNLASSNQHIYRRVTDF